MIKKILFFFISLIFCLSCTQSKYDKLKDGYDVGFIYKNQDKSIPYNKLYVYHYSVIKDPAFDENYDFKLNRWVQNPPQWYISFSIVKGYNDGRYIHAEGCEIIKLRDIEELWLSPHIKGHSRDSLYFTLTNCVELDEWMSWDSKHTIYLSDILKMTNNILSK